MTEVGREERTQASEVGALLRQTRVALGQSIAEVARDVRIRQTFIEAIENGRFEQLPGGAYTLGFIRTYSEHLGLEANEMVRRFKLETGAKAPAAKLNFPSPLGESGVPKGAILLIGAVIALIGYGIWYVSSSRYLDVAELTLPLPEHLRQMLPDGHGAGKTAGSSGRTDGTLPKVEVAIEAPADRRGAAPQAAAGANAGAAAESAPNAPPASTPPTSSAAGAGEPARPATTPPVPADPVAALPAGPQAGSPEPAASAAAAPATTPTGDAATGRVVLRATADTWVEIRDASRAIVLSRLMRPGDIFAVPDRPGLLLRTGNAGGLEVVIDGAPGGALGKPGTVRRNVALDVETLRTELSAVD